MELQVQKRAVLGRKSNALRKQGLVPAELYGRGLENLHLSVPLKDLRRVYKQAGENTVVQILVEKEKRPALIQDVTYDPLTGEVDSVDFYQVRMDEKLKVGVPVELAGTAPAIKEKKGVLVKALQEVEVEALPSDIPRSLKASLSSLTDIGQSIYVKDLDIPAGVRVLVSPETVVATVTAKITEEEELAAQQAAAVGAGEVKVETEEAKKEREAVKAAAGPASEAAAPAAEVKSAKPAQSAKGADKK